MDQPHVALHQFVKRAFRGSLTVVSQQLGVVAHSLLLIAPAAAKTEHARTPVGLVAPTVAIACRNHEQCVGKIASLRARLI
jgi:hypothetical protein